MDTTLYEELSQNSHYTAPSLNKMRPIQLFSHVEVKLEQPLDGILSSVDLGLPSPDLDRFLLQDVDLSTDLTSNWSSGMLSVMDTTETKVTEEQEAYARGFVDALEELHKRKGSPGYEENSDSKSIASSPISYQDFNGENILVTKKSGTCLPTLQLKPELAEYPQFSNRSSTGGTIHHMAEISIKPRPVSSTTSGGVHSTYLAQPYQIHRFSLAPQPKQSFTSLNYGPALSKRVCQIKEELQMVPSLGCTPPISPICMEDQEVLKLERKRARNRMAARKCRSRKLEQIAQLEGRVSDLKDQNENLADEASKLRHQVLSLRGLLSKHLQTDCKLPS